MFKDINCFFWVENCNLFLKKCLFYGYLRKFLFYVFFLWKSNCFMFVKWIGFYNSDKFKVFKNYSLYSFKILDLFIWFILELLLYDWYLLVKIVLKYLLNGGLEVGIY